MDVKFWFSVSLCIALFAMMVVSLSMNAKPSGAQNQSLLGVVVATSVLAGIVGWFIGYILFKGNPTAQIHFLLFFTFILFATTLTSASVSAFQLYGIRNAVATNEQKNTSV
jgi:hypothetical protein